MFLTINSEFYFNTEVALKLVKSMKMLKTRSQESLKMILCNLNSSPGKKYWEGILNGYVAAQNVFGKNNCFK